MGANKVANDCTCCKLSNALPLSSNKPVCKKGDRVSVRVCVSGRLGPEIQTHRGTRQGSELSPLLFGLFMDLLHELIKLQVPDSGPVIGDLSHLLSSCGPKPAGYLQA
jgi:hypothetical protein